LRLCFVAKGIICEAVAMAFVEAAFRGCFGARARSVVLGHVLVRVVKRGLLRRRREALFVAPAQLSDGTPLSLAVLDLDRDVYAEGVVEAIRSGSLGGLLPRFTGALILASNALDVIDREHARSILNTARFGSMHRGRDELARDAADRWRDICMCGSIVCRKCLESDEIIYAPLGYPRKRSFSLLEVPKPRGSTPFSFRDPEMPLLTIVGGRGGWRSTCVLAPVPRSVAVAVSSVVAEEFSHP